MQEFIKSSLSYFPKYFFDLIEIAVNPKGFLAQKSLADEEITLDAFKFLGVTGLFSIVIGFPMLPKSQNMSEYMSVSFLTLMAAQLFFTILMLIALRISWRLIGGIASFKQLFVHTAYLLGPSTYIMSIFSITGEVFFRIMDPEAAAAVHNQPMLERMHQEGHVDEVFAWIGLAASCLWGIYSWGAYRAINNVSRIRSAAAYFLSLLFSIPLLMVAFVFAVYTAPK